jgi:glycosyltransferase involved in cell wall biosynthesis
VTSEDLNMRLEKLSGAVTQSVVLPCSSYLSREYQKTQSQLEKQQIETKSIFWSSVWDDLDPIFKSSLKLGATGIFFTDLDKLANHGIPEETSIFFLALKQNWNFKKWISLPESVRSRVQIFFPPNTHSVKDYFTAVEVYEIFGPLSRQDPPMKFGSPFGHDLLDVRNEEHRDWIFNQSEKWKSPGPNQAKISVIIPTYNRRDLMQKVMHSLKSQTLQAIEFEILILDDGSNDSTEDALKAFSIQNPQLNIRYFFIPRNIGLTSYYVGNRVGPIRNLGAQNARADHLLFLDSDIVVPEDYLENVLEIHKQADVVLPRRVYLNKSATDRSLESGLQYGDKDILITPWQSYLDSFYDSGDWIGQEIPWKYFMTYCLSVKKTIFRQVGGFRTNFISYGYEDLDFGFRTVQLNPRLQFFRENVYHLYHFDQNSSEYGMSQDFRKFQLAMTSRMFIFQNIPLKFPYLKQMAQLSNFQQKAVYWWFRCLWKGRELAEKVLDFAK